MSYSHEEQQMLAKKLVTQFIDVAKMDDKGINEAEKAFAYLRHASDIEQLLALCQARNGKSLFSQTKNTPIYYSQLHKALDAFNLSYPHIKKQDFCIIFGWAIRLAKYCLVTNKNIGAIIEEHEHLKLNLLSEQLKSAHSSPSSSTKLPSAHSSPPVAANLPVVGDVITGQRARQPVTLRFQGERKKVVTISPNRTVNYTLPRNTVLEIYADDQITGGGFYGTIIGIDDSEPRKLVLLVKREKRPSE